jgi:hypothetical protein
MLLTGGIVCLLESKAASDPRGLKRIGDLQGGEVLCYSVAKLNKLS